MNNNCMCLQSDDTELEQKFGDDNTSALQKFLRGIWQKIVNAVLTSQELKVWQKVDSYGHNYWEAYDPATGKSFTSGSESDMLAWIEQLYR
ncbi:hypothetical protein [Fischerella sp. PCC 9605]|uniref:hypothetical protein n=1 Tax=Fischerella sp. PCC 9605 TaxID=1173024 RepID=UPI00047D802D|nr:hypothetical protein [Fischerella sp. PCC 9605]